MDKPDDIVRDMIERLHQALNTHPTLDAAFWLCFEDEVRQQWGGELQYIAKTSEKQIEHKTRRDRAIVREHHQGEHIPFLARRYGLSERRVRQILRGNESP